MEHFLIELHLHLDGSLSVASARELARINGMSLPEEDSAVRKMLMCPHDCKNLAEYLECFSLPIRLLQKAEALESAAFTLCKELDTKGYLYAELRFAPQHHILEGLTQEEAVQAVLRGIQRSGFFAQAILCCMRKDGFEAENMETLRLTSAYLGKGVCACDLGGAETENDLEHYAYILREAKRLAIPMILHAGEAAGPGNVALAVKGGALRIGHGVRSAEDPEVLRLLRESGVPLELCPTSNLNTCIYESYAEIPIPTLLDAGVKITINSDNMSVSDTDVYRELSILKGTFGFSDADLKALLLASADAAFLSPSDKENLKRRIDNTFANTTPF